MAGLEDRLKRLSFPDGEFDNNVRRTYVALRLWVGGIGFFLPIILVFWGLTHDIPWHQMTSISAFYWLHTPTSDNPPLRDWFVGSLWAVGIALVIYRGYGLLENWLLNLAGLTLIVVALKPMAWSVTDSARSTFSVHGTATVVFFLLIAATIWFCAANTLHKGLDDQVRLRWLRIYKIFAIAMLAAPLVAFVVSKQGQWAIWVETLGIWIFSSYWFTKTYELLKVSEVEAMGKPPPKLKWVGGELRITDD
jgi:hypothetical protein